MSTLPAIHAVHLADFVQERFGISAAAVLGELDREDLEAPGAKLSLTDYERIAVRAHALSNEPGLPIFFGMRMRISAHGYLGFAAMTARTLGEALSLAVRFAPTRTTAISLHLDDDGDEATLTIEEDTDLGGVREALLFVLLIGIWKIGNDLTGQDLKGSVELSTREPEYFARFKHLFPGKLSFAQKATRLRFASELLKLPLLQADAAAQRLARAQCERELDELFAGDDLTRTRLALKDSAGRFLSEEAVARRLAMSPRTLKRRLAAHGTTFSALMDSARSHRAMTLLSGPHLGVEQVAAELGYSDAANFSRAFKRWTGETPARFRVAFKREQGAQPRPRTPSR